MNLFWLGLSIGIALTLAVCGSEIDKGIERRGGTIFTCHNPDCPCSGYFSKQLWNTRPIEDALQARIAELEAENKALKLIANSHSMSELRRNQILAGDKGFKYPPAPERKEQ